MKNNCLRILGFMISSDGFIITNSRLAKWICDAISSLKNKTIVKLSQNFYIINN